MRLGQLARKLSLRPAQIVEFLVKNNIQIEESSNARLEDIHVTVIIQHFAPDSFEQIVEETEEIEEVVQVENDQPIGEPVTPEPEVVENQSTDEPEVIRVPKIELSGLKVLGKIELPEPKKKETIADEGEVDKPSTTIEEKPQAPKRKPKREIRERPQQRPWKNPLELQREREAREAEEKKRIAIEREKEKRKRYYEEKVKSVAQPKRVKPVKEEPEVKRKPVDTRPIPKTWLGEFLRWWTT